MAAVGLFDDIVPPENKGADQWDIVEDVPLSSLPPPDPWQPVADVPLSSIQATVDPWQPVEDVPLDTVENVTANADKPASPASELPITFGMGDMGYHTFEAVRAVTTRTPFQEEVARQQAEYENANPPLQRFKQRATRGALNLESSVLATRALGLAEELQQWQSPEPTDAFVRARMARMAPEQREAVIVRLTDKLLDDYADAITKQAEAARLPTAPVVAAGRGQSLGTAMESALVDPVSYVAEVGASSLPQSVVPLAMAGAGALSRGRAGAIAGTGAGSFLVDYAGELAGELAKLGVDPTDREAVKQALADPQFLEHARSGAARHASAVALFDALSFRLAGFKMAPKSAGPITREAVNIPTQAVAQGLAGAAGEGVGQLAKSGRIDDPSQLLEESAGAAVSAPVDAAAMAGMRRSGAPVPGTVVPTQPAPATTIASDPARTTGTANAEGTSVSGLFDDIVSPPPDVEAQPGTRPAQAVTTTETAKGSTPPEAQAPATPEPIAAALEESHAMIRETNEMVGEALRTVTASLREATEVLRELRSPPVAESVDPDVETGPTSDIGDRSLSAAAVDEPTPETKLGDALDRLTKPLKAVGKEAIDVTGGKAISYLDDLAKASPTAKKLRNAMEYTEFSDEPIAPSYYERVSLKTGEHMTRLDSILNELRGVFRKKIPDKANAELLEALRGGPAKAPIGEAALKLRELLNGLRDYARAQGVEVGFIGNYFPRLYKQNVLRTERGRDDFVRVLMKHGVDATTADTIAEKIVNNDGIFVADGERSPRVTLNDVDAPFRANRVAQEGGPRRQKQLETARKLADIPDQALAPFLESNVAAVLRRYVENTVKRAEYAGTFGPDEGKLNAMVRDIIKEASQAGRPVRRKELQRIYDLADALQGQYRPILSNVGRAANNFVSAYQYVRTLPLAVLSSLSEPFLVVARGRPGTVPRALARSLDHALRETIRTVYHRFPKAEATKALEHIGLGLDAALSERLTASFGGEVTKFTSTFFKLNFLHQWTRFTRVLANEAGKLMVERHLKDLVQGVSPARTTQIERELTELGIPVDAGKAWVNRGAHKDDRFYKTIEWAGLRFTNETIMNPRPTNRPMWHSNPHYHLLAQLKGFQTVFGNTVLPRWYDMLAKRGAYEGVRNATKIATAGVLMVLAAMLGNELRDLIKYGLQGNPRNIGEEPTRKMYRAMERAGFLGVFQFASDAMFAHRFGSPAVAQLAGPTVSQLNEAIEATGKAIGRGDTDPLTRETVNAVPLVNVVPALRKELAEIIERGFGDHEIRRRIDDAADKALERVRNQDVSNAQKRAEVEKIMRVRDGALRDLRARRDKQR